MQQSNVPTKSPIVFGASATGTYIRTVPQTTADPAAASFTLGFPPQTFTDEGAGGTPPDGRDFNGILNHLSAWTRWFMAGGTAPYDGTFQTAIGGYPRNAVVGSLTNPGRSWRSLVDNNTSNPDSGGANWVIVDRLIAQLLNDNNGYRIWDSGFKQAWGYSNSLAPGASQSIAFSSFMGANVFTSFHRVVLGSGIAPSGSKSADVGITSTNVSGFTVRNGGSDTLSFQWSTEGV